MLHKLLRVFIALAIVGTTVYFAFNMLMSSLVHNKKEVVTPNVVGKSLYNALGELSKEGFGIRKDGLNKSLKKSLGNIIIVSAPSGAGKTAICKAVIKSSKNIAHSISYTTRFPRKGEKNGREYFFVDEANFKKMIKEKKFAEWAKVHNSYYGTSKDLLLKVLESGKNILLEIDVQGGASIKKQYPQACMIFIMTPDFKTLEERLIARNTDSKEVIEMRLNNARKEIEHLQKYEYLIVNKKLDDAVEAVKTIVKSLEYKVVKNQKYFD